METRPLAAIVALAAALAPELAAGEDWLVERREWTFAVEPAAAVAFDNPWGNVYLRVGGPGEVYVLVNSQRDAGDPRRFDLEAGGDGGDGGDGTLALRVVSSRPEGLEIGDGWERRRADFTVLVPPGSPVRLATRDGLIEARGTRRPISARTETGDVRLRIGGPFDVRSTHGHVLVQLLRTDFRQASAVTTATGRIRVELPLGAGARVDLSTRGEITTDYSIDVDRSDPTRLKRGTLRTGDGGARLELESAQGDVDVVELLVPEVSSPDD